MVEGSQDAGDALTEATLETLADGLPDFILGPAAKGDADLRLALYRMFCRFSKGPLAQKVRALSTPQPDGPAANTRLQRLTPQSRVAFMLLAVEGFSVEAAAEILHLRATEVTALIDKARREIADQVATDVLIIEDELFIANDLKRMMLDLGHRVTGVARTRQDAAAKAKAQPPGLVLADIQLADGSSGIDAANDILAERTVPVVFITAYPERLLTGQRPEPTFLITKPFNVDDVRVTVCQSLFFAQPN